MSQSSARDAEYFWDNPASERHTPYGQWHVAERLSSVFTNGGDFSTLKQDAREAELKQRLCHAVRISGGHEGEDKLSNLAELGIAVRNSEAAGMVFVLHKRSDTDRAGRAS